MSKFVDPLIINYIQDNNLHRRSEVVNELLCKYPTRIPVIIGRGEIKRTPPIKKYKFLVPRELSLGNLIVQARKEISNIDEKVALFFFVSNGILPPVSSSMADLYFKYKSDDGFLYITYMVENTFGFNLHTVSENLTLIS